MSWKLASAIQGLDKASMEAAQSRHNQLTKPPGSLGQLEEIAIRLAGIQQTPIPAAESCAVVVMAGDHGVTEEGVSAFPSDVTLQMVLNFLNGGAAINALARNAGADVHVVDVGVKSDVPDFRSKANSDGKVSCFWKRKVAYGTANMALGPAMTKEQVEQALQVGWSMGDRLAELGYQIVALGEMGIGNTTSSAALAAVFTGKPVIEVAGAGTGMTHEGVMHKVRVIEQALAKNKPVPEDPIDVLAKVGGLEIAGLAGLTLSCAAHRIAVVVDGFITSAAVLAAYRINSAVGPFLFASHQSAEPGHRIVLAELGLKPLFELGMRLGEGSGAALALPIMRAACRVLREMATFAEAGVADGK